MNRRDWMRELEEKHGWTFGKNTTTPKPDKAAVPKPEEKTKPAKKES